MVSGNNAFVSEVLATVVLVLVTSSFVAILRRENPLSHFPIIAVNDLSPKLSWIKHGKAVIQKGIAQCSGPFQVMTGSGPKLVLPNRCADEIRNDQNFSLMEAMKVDFFTSYPGFDGARAIMHSDDLIIEAARVKLTQSLGVIMDDLVEEATDTVHEVFGEDDEWQNVYLNQSVLELIARITSRAFLGKPLCREREWLEITKHYAVDLLQAARDLRAWPWFTRPFAHWFIPTCKRLRAQVRDAQSLVKSEVERRAVVAQHTLDAGGKPARAADAIAWIIELSKGRAQKVDLVAAQLGLSITAMHTTVDALNRAMLDICEHPELVKDLREEVIRVFKEHGWTRNGLYELKYMDSLLKESQRRHRIAVSMERVVLKTTTLADGTKLPKGGRVAVATKFFDPQTYPQPLDFDASRFLRKREEPGLENSWQYVTTSAEHLGFGHGIHSCPGRFFAANALKIALCLLLLKYDWKLGAGEGTYSATEYEGATVLNPETRIQFRRRREEIEL